jgi:hypothetical protein
MKKPYAAPAMELFQMEFEGAVMTPSISVPGYGEGGNFDSSASSTYGAGTHSTASNTDLEEMINDILTY